MIGFSFNLVYQSLNVIACTKTIHKKRIQRSQKSSKPIELGDDDDDDEDQNNEDQNDED